MAPDVRMEISNQITSEILDVAERPNIAALASGFHAVIFGLIKIVAARHILRVAQRRGELTRGTRVLESSSGSMALALALACREKDFALTVVGDNAINEELRGKLNQLGVEVILLSGPFTEGGPQHARVQRVQELMQTSTPTFWACQYDNPAGREAYFPIGAELCARIGRVDVLVASVGTGASACGMIRGIRLAGCQARLVAVDTHGSVLFGHQDRPRILRGLGNSIYPANLVYEEVDECHWVTAQEAFAAARELRKTFNLDCGPTSGATFLVADWLRRNNPDLTIAFVCADTGDRYRNTVLNEGWLRDQGLLLTTLPHDPILVHDPGSCTEAWSRMEWNRRHLKDIVA
jgi:cysteine synthase A